MEMICYLFVVVSSFVGLIQGFPTRTTFLVGPSLVTTTTTTTTQSWMIATSPPDKQRTQNIDDNEVSLLEDGHGHINREVAEQIWNWEHQLRMDSNRPDLPYSTRQGLRLVNSIVQDIIQKQQLQQNDKEDLIQEGIIALMVAMNEYKIPTATADKENEELLFEKYAREHITLQLTQPKQQKQQQQQQTQTNQQTQKQTQTQTRRQQTPLSMESTIEIDDPLLDQTSYVSNQDEWELRQGLVLDNGHQVNQNEYVEEYLDEMIQYEGEDQMYLQQNQVAAPLKEMIPDDDEEEADDGSDKIHRFTIVTTEQATSNEETKDDFSSTTTLNSVDDQALTDMIRFNVDEFLASTLNDVETRIIQLRFGLELSSNKQEEQENNNTKLSSNIKPMTKKTVATTLGLSVEEVTEKQESALIKLRQAYTDRYLEQRTEDDDDIGWEDSV